MPPTDSKIKKRKMHLHTLKYTCIFSFIFYVILYECGNIATLAFLNDSQKVKYLIIYLNINGININNIDNNSPMYFFSFILTNNEVKNVTTKTARYPIKTLTTYA